MLAAFTVATIAIGVFAIVSSRQNLRAIIKREQQKCNTKSLDGKDKM